MIVIATNASLLVHRTKEFIPDLISVNENKNQIISATRKIVTGM
jgi:hypothetical protein